MVDNRTKSFRIKRKTLLLKWLPLLLLVASTIVVPFMIAVSGQRYPDLTIAPIFFAMTGFIWVPLAAEYWRQTTAVQLEETQFTIKKFAQRPKRFSYSDSLAYNERLDFGRGDQFNVLTIYLSDDFFIIKSNEFDEYEQLKEGLLAQAQPTTYLKVMTLAERNRLRWMISGLALFILANIAFAYLAHDPADPAPARLVTVTDLVEQVREDRPKGQLKGVTFSLRSYPSFSFYVSRKDYDIHLDRLMASIRLRQPVDLLIRESDYRKKLRETEPLTLGDKFSNYKQIPTFGVRQTGSVQLQTTRPVHEPTHTNPGQRTFLLSVLLLFCWTGWAYVDRHKILRAN
ncbi:hypothetical protein [Spirosoma lituiforme]